jgi:hypothetical protein
VIVTAFTLVIVSASTTVMDLILEDGSKEVVVAEAAVVGIDTAAFTVAKVAQMLALIRDPARVAIVVEGKCVVVMTEPEGTTAEPCAIAQLLLQMS